MRVIIPTAILIAGALLGFSRIYTEKYLTNLQTERQKQLFSPGLNQQLMDYFADLPGDIKVLTPYPLDYIPGLHGQITFTYGDLEAFNAYVDSGDIDYLLYPEYTSQPIIEEITAGEETGKFTYILENKEWISFTLIKINQTQE